MARRLRDSHPWLLFRQQVTGATQLTAISNTTPLWYQSGAATMQAHHHILVQRAITVAWECCAPRLKLLPVVPSATAGIMSGSVHITACPTAWKCSAVRHVYHCAHAGHYPAQSCHLGRTEGRSALPLNAPFAGSTSGRTQAQSLSGRGVLLLQCASAYCATRGVTCPVYLDEKTRLDVGTVSEWRK